MKNCLLVPLFISLLGNVASSSNDVEPPIGCEIHKLGDPNTEKFSPSISFTEHISATLNITRVSWQEFSFGFESSSKEPIGILKFSKDSNVSLTLKNWDSSNEGDKEKTKLLPKDTSSKLQSGKWIKISLKRSKGNLMVNIDNAEQIVFTEVETSQFHYVYAHVKSDQYIEVGFNCLDTFLGSTSVPKLDEENSGESTTSGGGGGVAVGIIFLIILVAAAIGGGIWFKKKKEKQKDPRDGFLEEVVQDKDEEKLYSEGSEEFNPLLGKQSKVAELHQQRTGESKEKTIGVLSDTRREVRDSSYMIGELFDSTDNARETSEKFKCQNNDNSQTEEENSVSKEMRSEGKTEKTASSEGISPAAIGETDGQLIPAETSSSILEKEDKQTSGETVSDTNSTSGVMESKNNEMLMKHEAALEDSDTEKEAIVHKIACNKQEENQAAQPELLRDTPEDDHNHNRDTETEGMLEATNMDDCVTEENLENVSAEVLAHNNDSSDEDVKSDTASVVNESPDGILYSKAIPNGKEEDPLNPASEIMDTKMNEKELSDEKSPLKELNESQYAESNLNVDISQDALNETESLSVPTEPSSQAHEDENMNEKVTAEEEALQQPTVDTADKQQNAVTLVKESPSGIPLRDTNEIPNSTGENPLNSESEIMDKTNKDKEKLFSDEKSPTKELNEGSSTESNLNADISQDVLNEIESQIVPTELLSQIHEDQNRNKIEKATTEAEGLEKPLTDTTDKQQNAVKMGQGKDQDQSADRITEDEGTNFDGKPAEVEKIVIVKMISKRGENETTHPDRLKQIDEDNKDDTQYNVDIGNSQEDIGKKNTCDIQNKGTDDNSPFHTKL